MKRNTNIDNKNSVTIKDVAKAAEVSIATVSRILNDKVGVSPALVKRVQEAVVELGYQPNAVARALKVSKSRSIGLVIPDIENPFFPAMVRGVEDAAQVHKYAIILCNTDGDPEKEKKYINFLFSKRVDGILFTGGGKISKTLEVLTNLPIPVVFLDRKFSGTGFSGVYTDNIQGTYLSTEHLIQGGCRRIVFIGGPKDLCDDRLKGFYSALKKYHWNIENKSKIMYCNFSFESGYQAAYDLIIEKENFDGVVCANDLMAIGVIECLLKHGIKVPQDVKVTGYDNIRLSEWYKPALTTVNQPIYEMGQQAVKLMVEQLTGRQKEVVEKMLKPTLVVRKSSSV